MINTTRYATAVPVVLALIWLLTSCPVCGASPATTFRFERDLATAELDDRRGSAVREFVAEVAQTSARIRKTPNSGKFGYFRSALRQRPVVGLMTHCWYHWSTGAPPTNAKGRKTFRPGPRCVH